MSAEDKIFADSRVDCRGVPHSKADDEDKTNAMSCGDRADVTYSICDSFDRRGNVYIMFEQPFFLSNILLHSNPQSQLVSHSLLHFTPHTCLVPAYTQQCLSLPLYDANYPASQPSRSYHEHHPYSHDPDQFNHNSEPTQSHPPECLTATPSPPRPTSQRTLTPPRTRSRPS